MKAVFKTGLIVHLILLTGFLASAQNVTLLKDRLYYDTTGNEIYPWRYGDLYQAKIIDGFIYTIETWSAWYDPHLHGEETYYAKYDLNGNLIKRKKFPFTFNVNADGSVHLGYGNITIWKADGDNIVCYMPIVAYADSTGASKQYLFKFNTNLDSLKLSTYVIAPQTQIGFPERSCIQTKDGNYLLVTGLDFNAKRVRKIDKDFNTLWSLDIDTVPIPRRTEIGSSTSFMKNSAVNEINNQYYITSLKTCSRCTQPSDDTACGSSLPWQDIHIFTITENGNLIRDDSISNPFPATDVVNILPQTKGFRIILRMAENSYDLIRLLSLDTLSRVITSENELEGPYDFIISNPYYTNAYVKNMKLYQFNSDHSNAFLNMLSAKPVPDSLYIYYAQRFRKILEYNTSWIDENADSSYLILGSVFMQDSGRFMSIIPLSNLFGAYTGKVLKDNIKNCLTDGADTPYKNLTVEVNKTSVSSPYRYYTHTDEAGKFEFLLDSGQYQAKVYPASNLWASCPQTQSFTFDSHTDSVTNNFYIQRTVFCPKLTVSISTDRLRICRENIYTVNYCNMGTADAANAFITVDLDSALTINSSTFPYTQAGNTYTFQIGNVKEDSCRKFTITTILNCTTQVGATICVTAHIYPDSLCGGANTLWDKSNVVVNARCLGDSVEFRIKNTGTGNMSMAKNYYITENETLRISPQSFQLNAGQQLFIKRFANGSTQRISAEQSDHFPYPSHPTAVVESCGGLNAGFVNSFPNDDDAGFISISCTQSRGSNDPNEKEAAPTGVNPSHDISKGTDIEYKINFQNTGNDTAYDVYILDTLSKKLNPGSLVMGVSSHPYTYEIYGEGILKVVFPNINLVDSLHNEPLSHGYFTYRISQDSLTKNNDKILNSASIYFDSNHPVQTNTTLHTVADNLFSIVSSVIENKWNITTKAYPNPFNEKCIISIQADKPQNGTYHFTLYNMNGQLIKEQTVQDKVELLAKELPANIYLYRIEYNGELVNAGKIIRE